MNPSYGEVHNELALRLPAAPPAAGLANDRVGSGAVEPVDVVVINEQSEQLYAAVVDGREVAGLPYIAASKDRLVLLATSVISEYRGRGIATELIRRTLDDIRSTGRTITVLCPVVRAFIDKNPGYADLVDTDHPGLRGRRSATNR